MLKILAAALMLVDHAARVFVPQYEWLRMIGRLAMPLFAYAIATGFYFASRKGTFPKYLLQMAGFAVVSQVPFLLLRQAAGLEGFDLNIGVTWFLALLVLQAVFAGRESGEAVLDQDGGLPRFLWYVIGAGALAIAYFVPMDYGIYGVLYPLACYPVVRAVQIRARARADSTTTPPLPVSPTLPGESVQVDPSLALAPPAAAPKQKLLVLYLTGGISQMLLNLGARLLLGMWPFQPLALVAFPIMCLDSGRKSRVNKWFFYVFYPVHLFLIWVIASLIR